jgi:hypothetical protein
MKNKKNENYIFYNMAAIKEEIPMQLKRTIKYIFGLVEKKYPEIYDGLKNWERHIDTTDSIHLLDFILEKTCGVINDVYIGIKPQKQSLFSSVLIPYEILTSTDFATILLLRIKISEYLGKYFMFDCKEESKLLVKKLKTFNHQMLGTTILIIPNKAYEITKEEANNLYALDLIYRKYTQEMDSCDPQIKTYTIKNISNEAYQLFKDNKYMIIKDSDGDYQIAV